MINHHYIEAGEGEPLIMLHGNGESCEVFSNQIEEFSKHFHIYALDTRGHGKTPRGNKPFTLVQFAEDLNVFMESHNIEKANIFGFSDGGNIAMLFAIKYPNKVKKLVLNGANYNPKGLVFYFRLYLPIRYAMVSFSKNPKAEMERELLNLMIKEPNISERELQSISAPTLVIAGTRDLIKKSHTMEIARLIPNSELAFVKGNHAVLRMNPGEFNPKVLDFLTK